MMSGPLKGITIVEFVGIGPGPFCGMILADLGAEIIRIDRSSQHGHGNTIDFQHRSKLSLSADLKNQYVCSRIGAHKGLIYFANIISYWQCTITRRVRSI